MDNPDLSGKMRGEEDTRESTSMKLMYWILWICFY